MNPTLPDFASAYLTLRQQRADRFVDELAINTFRQLLSDESASASVRLKAAMEIVKLVEAQRPTTLSTALAGMQGWQQNKGVDIAGHFEGKRQMSGELLICHPNPPIQQKETVTPVEPISPKNRP